MEYFRLLYQKVTPLKNNVKKFFFFYYATIVTRLTNTGLIRAVVGIGVVFGALILGVASYPSLRGQLFFLCYF
jgi:hypothetical protein